MNPELSPKTRELREAAAEAVSLLSHPNPSREHVDRALGKLAGASDLPHKIVRAFAALAKAQEAGYNSDFVAAKELAHEACNELEAFLLPPCSGPTEASEIEINMAQKLGSVDRVSALILLLVRDDAMQPDMVAPKLRKWIEDKKFQCFIALGDDDKFRMCTWLYRWFVLVGYFNPKTGTKSNTEKEES